MTTSPEPDTSDSISTDALDRSQQAIDEGNEAAQKALSDESPTPELDAPGTGSGLESSEEDVAPRPN